MGKNAKKEFTKEQLAAAQKIASSGGTKQEISKLLKVNRAVVDRLVRDNIVVITPSPRNLQGRKYQWTPQKIERLKEMYASDRYCLQDVADEFNTSEATIMNEARRLGIKKVRKAFWQPEDDQFLRDNIKKVGSLKELAEWIGRTEDIVSDRLKVLGIFDQRPIKKRASEIHDKLFNNPKFVEQFGNPTYSHERMSRIWGVSSATINKWRRQKFGSWKRLNDTYLGKTTAEMDFEKILEELDLAFIYQYRVGKWENDYYLGFHVIAEVQGMYWHSLEKVKEKDKRKKKSLESKGYTIVYIHEEELGTKAGRQAIKKRVNIAIKNKLKDRFEK